MLVNKGRIIRLNGGNSLMGLPCGGGKGGGGGVSADHRLCLYCVCVWKTVKDTPPQNEQLATPADRVRCFSSGCFSVYR